jgi:hypothetical protein
LTDFEAALYHPRIYFRQGRVTKSQQKAVRIHRQRLKVRGLQRVEVQASEDDAELIRTLARCLRDDDRAAARVRRQLRAAVKRKAPTSLKVLLTAAPLDGIRIARSRDRARSADV